MYLMFLIQTQKLIQLINEPDNQAAHIVKQIYSEGADVKKHTTRKAQEGANFTPLEKKSLLLRICKDLEPILKLLKSKQQVQTK